MTFMPQSNLIISLDFELHWGVRDHTSVEAYRTNLLGVRQAIPAMLALFARRGVAATWATVGFLFADTKQQLEAHFPSHLPTYDDPALSPYAWMSEVGPDEAADPFHFGASLLRQIASTPRQEVATHTFSHYYCLASGQRIEQFEADLQAAATIAKLVTSEPIRSIVFPRNQFADAHLRALQRLDYQAYRGNPEHWAYEPVARETPQRRLFRLVDSYVPLTRSRASDSFTGIANVEATAFLRPYASRLRRLEPLRRIRLYDTMTRAAREGHSFHLWWHPHNFGSNLSENMQFLEALLDHFAELRRHYGMESMTMAEAASSSMSRQRSRSGATSS